ncbi:substrate-binding domain-containing protein [Bdellovibrio sp. 22V]|uniref:substrate-binding domain-containing protein n=1 Tax=Bdellovibrio sp. 22V TaxID=3044166 RepID=UPI002542EDE1|nr:substrate-binding domain-containing protein [Bdellovibrio sp. 22V]WII71467.1 substrate-binding domain-containing protein [Bdellovibrio sp. 22V]
MRKNHWLRYSLLILFLAPFAFADRRPLSEVTKPRWNGPHQGPVGVLQKQVDYIASDLRNEGASTVGEGFQSAARHLKWKVQIKDGMGSKRVIEKHLQDAINNKVHGIVLGGFDSENFEYSIKEAQEAGIKIVGWHSGDKPGKSKYLFTNVTTNPVTVAENAAALVSYFGAKRRGVIIFTDTQFSIARTKSETMRQAVEKIKNATVLDVLDIAVSEAHEKIPATVQALNAKYGKKWTHSLAVNDIYFDHMNFPLKSIGRKDIVNISAGDGSPKALSRIRSGVSQQVASIAEPLHAQGWQVADELNRAFTPGASESGFVSDPLVITRETLGSANILSIEASLPFVDTYLKVWFPNQK